MKSWIVLPYDASPIARAALMRAAKAIVKSDRYAGVMLATAGIDPSQFDQMMYEAEAVAGPGVPLELYLLDPGDPVGALHRLADSVPDAVLAAPLSGARGKAQWYRDASVVGGSPHTLMIFLIDDSEIREVEASTPVAHRGHRGAAAALRSFAARLHRDTQAPAVQPSASRH